MRPFSSGIFKVLFRQRNINLTYNSLKTTVNNVKVVNDSFTPEIMETISIIKKYQLPVPWEQVTKELAEYGDIHSVILRTCWKLKDVDFAMSYYKYIIDKGENLSEVNLFMIINALSVCPPAKIMEYEELLIYLFDKCRDFFNSKVFQNYAIQVFSYIPHCFRELVQMSKNCTEFVKNGSLVCRAFDFDDPSLAWELLERSDYVLFPQITKSFTNYCIRQALMNKFSIDIIQKWINLCQKKGVIIPSDDILCALLPLTQVLTHSQDDYIWSVKKCTVNPQMECLNCSTVLKEHRISKDEFKILKNAVFKTLIPSNDIFLKTSKNELQGFNYFLTACEPFDVVVDGLNFMYCGIQTSKKKVAARLLEKFLMDQKKRVLVVSRKHSQAAFLFKKLKNVQTFLTDNLSDDDVFVLFAALSGGWGTNIITSDFLCTHSSKLSPEIKTLFIKWQLYHQYIIDTRTGFVLPSLHVGLPQCTVSPEMGGDSYKWHLSYQENQTSSYSFRVKFDWVCLQAIPKKKQLPKQIQKTVRTFTKKG